ncbi:hypothetical protein ACSS6W_008385 [Trichoderma asperelloides]
MSASAHNLDLSTISGAVPRERLFTSCDILASSICEIHRSAQRVPDVNSPPSLPSLSLYLRKEIRCIFRPLFYY